MQNYVVQVTVGRVVEGRPFLLRTRDEGVAYCDAFRATVRAVGRPVVVCADYRKITVFPPPVADELRRLMIDMNPLVERSAILVTPEHSTNVMQVERVVRETQHPNRRRFETSTALQTWLGEVLTPEERTRVAAFLAEGDPRPPPAPPRAR